MHTGNLKKNLGLLLGLTVALVVGAGCHSDGDAGTGSAPQSKAEQDKRRQDAIDAIKNDPNMPESEKARALAGYSMSQGMVKKK